MLQRLEIAFSKQFPLSERWGSNTMEACMQNRFWGPTAGFESQLVLNKAKFKQFLFFFWVGGGLDIGIVVG